MPPPAEPAGPTPADPAGTPPSSGPAGPPPPPYAPSGDSEPTAATPPPGQDPWEGYTDPNQTPPPGHDAPGAPGSGPAAPGGPGYGAPPPGTPGHGTPPPGTPGYGTPPPGTPGYGTPPPGTPGYGTPPPGTPGYGPPPYGNGGYGTPGYGAPGYGPPPGYDPNTYPYGAQPAYGLPSGYYAGPDDPLVSPDFAGWFRRSFTLLSAVWQPMTLVQLVWAVPLLAIGVVAALITPDASVITDPQDVSFDDFLEPLLIILPFTLAAVVLSMVSQLATLDILVQRATGRPVSVGTALKNGLRRFFPLLGWQILAGLIILVGLLFCILPGLYFAVVLTVLTPIILLERGEGISRAFQLFHANFGAALGRIATVYGFYLAFTFVEGIFTSVIDPSGTAGTGVALFLAVVSTAFSVASGVVVAPMVLTAYADMRARREPFSTAYLAQQP
ncbi:hypothetical protein Aab01nite_73580 [Paractinoplanes abujensis]|uniref:Glycerophosphoryl diester phosphodiesterase membrane domain-containing protein n=1 Tax=Paractinoplanes abujensis TaxID=882441 RepID=A0A7W7G5L7_9ACTN|nr:hypothetical protein [Actinoplanes abujensis]MBB4695036.1 hypothetical protein [Actinoplanes abujensis]GID23768.1 hypothetical protein Aab01nite_73580 [Actinoplanes abujensis]